MAKFSGVFPIHDIKVEIGVTKATEGTWSYKTVANLETFSPSIDANIIEWNPMELEGWNRAMATGKKISIDFSGKRTVGDEGNDFIANKVLALGKELESNIKLTYPDKSSFSIDVIIVNKSIPGGDSNNVSNLEFTARSNGKPKYVQAV